MHKEIMSVTTSLRRSTFQARLYAWMITCFGEEITFDPVERNHRFFEEATEVVQALKMTREDAHMLVDYVYDRPIGEPTQEVGGAFVTLCALSIDNGFDLEELAEIELARVWGKIEKIRQKQKIKPKHSPLPE